MSRRTNAGGSSIRGSAKAVDRARARTPEALDPDAIPFDSVDWENAQVEPIEFDPAFVEQVRSRRTLKQVTIRIGVEQIEEARRVAARAGLKYQAVLRRWLAEGASLARSKRLREPAGPKAAKAG